MTAARFRVVFLLCVLSLLCVSRTDQEPYSMQVSWLIDLHPRSPSQPVILSPATTRMFASQWIAFAMNEDSLNTVAGPLRLLS